MMYKKIIALGLTAVLAFSAAITPVFACENQGSSFITAQSKNVVKTSYKGSMVSYDNKNKKNKGKDDYEDIVEKLLKSFFDSDEIDWATKSIEKLGAMGILNGKGNGFFKPKSNVTHAEAIAMVLKLTGYQEEAEAIKTQPVSFKGNSDSWSYGYLTLALEKGIIIPEEDGNINPRTPAKRHEIAKYIVRALGQRDLALQNEDAELNFKDAASIPANSVGYVYVATQLGLIQGSNGLFQPNKPITRAEMAVILDRAEGNIDVPSTNPMTAQGTVVSYDKTNLRLTLSINNNSVIYEVMPNVPVYKDNNYYSLDFLKAGDIVKIVTDAQKRIIFIEYKQTSTTPTNQVLPLQPMQYSNLPQAIKSKIDTLKLTANYAAFRYENNIYLISSRGQMPTSGYSIQIVEAYKEAAADSKFNINALVSITDPTVGIVTQAITYPYDVVKFASFDRIDKINFINSANQNLAQTTIVDLDSVETISGRVLSVDKYNRILHVIENDNITRSYIINRDVQITINGNATTLAYLEKDMFVTIIRENGIITKIMVTTTTPDGQRLYVQPIQYSNLPQAIKSKIDTLKLTANYAAFKYENNVYLIGSRGQVPTNGYSIQIKEAYKEAAADSKFNINALVTVIDPTAEIVTQVITYPYDVVKFASFDKIDKINFVNSANQNLAQTTLVDLDSVETISGKVLSVDKYNRILQVIESDNITRSYAINRDVQITINDKAVTLANLEKDMLVTIIRINGIITKIVATTPYTTITGRIDEIDLTNKILVIWESATVSYSYKIQDNAEISLNNQVAALSSLSKDMNATITVMDNAITKIKAQSDIVTVQGVLITLVTVQDKLYANLKVSTSTLAYEVTADTKVYYNNQAITIQNMPLNSNVTVKLLGNRIVEIKNR